MDQLVDFLDGMIKQAGFNFASGPQYRNNRWKYCVALAKEGWKAYDYQYVPTNDDDDVIIKWKKEGKEDIAIRLSFTEQQLWIEYLEKQESEK